MKKKQLVATNDSNEDVDSAMTPRYAYVTFIYVPLCVEGCSFAFMSERREK